MMTEQALIDKQQHFQQVLEAFIGRLKKDRNILAAVLIGSFLKERLWQQEILNLWLIETDGVSKRHASDGKDERIFRCLVEEDINIHAELIPRSRFKRMIEGSSRTAFSHSFFAVRQLLYTTDESIRRWFDSANQLATKDQHNALFTACTYVIYAAKEARKWLTLKEDLHLAAQELVCAAYGLAAIEIILKGEMYELEIIYKAIEYNPALFQTIYTNVVEQPGNAKVNTQALEAIETYLAEHGKTYLAPVLSFIQQQPGTTPLSRINDQFAYTQLYPWHLESACEWLTRQGTLEKISAPFRLTGKSRIDVEEPAYFDPFSG